jgi:hypothetical protein
MSQLIYLPSPLLSHLSSIVSCIICNIFLLILDTVIQTSEVISDWLEMSV